MEAIEGTVYRSKWKQQITSSKVALVISCLIALVLGVVSTVSSEWAKNTYFYRTEGLWVECRYDENLDEKPPECKSFPIAPEWLVACQAMVCTGVAFSFIGTLISYVGLFHKPVRGYYTTVIMFLSTVLFAATHVLYEDRTAWVTEQKECGMGYFFNWTAAVISFLSAFLGFCTF